MLKTLKTAVVAVGFGAVVFSAAPAMAAYPYYFVDNVSNKEPLFTDSGCTGANVKGCTKFGDVCGISLWSGSSTLDEALGMLRNGQSVHIRVNANPYNVVCTVNP